MLSRDGFKQCVSTIALLWLIAPTLLSAQSPELPDGMAQPKVRAACTECHDSRIIMQQRLGSKGWSKEIDKMVKWGAVVDPSDRNAFIDYLSINFLPDKAPAPSERVGPDKKK